MEEHKLVIHPKRPKGEDGYRTFSIRIKDDLADRLDAIAGKTGHSRNELVGILLDYALEHCTIAEK